MLSRLLAVDLSKALLETVTILVLLTILYLLQILFTWLNLVKTDVTIIYILRSVVEATSTSHMGFMTSPKHGSLTPSVLQTNSSNLDETEID